jgi:hypothetical protein
VSIQTQVSFGYEFSVDKHRMSQLLAPGNGFWTGPGIPLDGWDGGIAGASPQFELRSGWLTLFPSEPSTQAFPIHWFADQERRSKPGELDAAAFAADARSALDGARDLASYSLFVGEGLEKVLQIGDKLRFSHDGSGAFSYSARRDSVTVFSAGSVQSIDQGGPFAIWQSRDAYPRADEWPVQAPPLTLHEVGVQVRRFSEFADSHPIYVSVRILDRMFRLGSRQGARVDPYYVFVARTNSLIEYNGFPERAIHAAGRLDAPGFSLIEDAAEQLIEPKTRLL